jgi:hypothetical protein
VVTAYQFVSLARMHNIKFYFLQNREIYLPVSTSSLASKIPMAADISIKVYIVCTWSSYACETNLYARCYTGASAKYKLDGCCIWMKRWNWDKLHFNVCTRNQHISMRTSCMCSKKHSCLLDSGFKHTHFPPAPHSPQLRKHNPSFCLYHVLSI